MSELSAQDQQMVTSAKTLARLLEDQAMREYVKTEALKQFDGEHNLLYEFVRQQTVGDQLFSARLANSYVNNNSNSRVNAHALFNEEMQNIPLLNIGVPVHAETWDTDNFVPLVGIRTLDQDNNAKFIRAYDSKGELHYLDGINEPTVPVVIVRLNERLTPLKKGKELTYKFRYPGLGKNVNSHIAARLDEDEEDDPYDPPKPPPTQSGCSCNGKDAIHSIKYANIASMRSAESWDQGSHEFCIRIFTFEPGKEAEEITSKGRAISKNNAR